MTVTFRSFFPGTFLSPLWLVSRNQFAPTVLNRGAKEEMMMKAMTRMAIAAALSLGAIGTFSIPASAQDLEFRIGPNGVRPGIRTEARCSPGDAREAARDEGFSRPQVVRTTSRSVTVQGWTEDGPDRITFANRPGCPVI